MLNVDDEVCDRRETFDSNEKAFFANLWLRCVNLRKITSNERTGLWDGTSLQ